MPSLTAIGTILAHENQVKKSLLTDHFFHRKHQENDHIELPLYKSLHNDNLSCMLSWLSLKMLVLWNMAKVISSEINSK